MLINNYGLPYLSIFYLYFMHNHEPKGQTILLTGGRGERYFKGCFFHPHLIGGCFPYTFLLVLQSATFASIKSSTPPLLFQFI
jgi:hypothetical protein